MNHVLMLTHNGLALTKKAVASVDQQDIDTTLNIIDNFSTDGTCEWIQSGDFEGTYIGITQNAGVSYGWNMGLRVAFDRTGYDPAEYVLVINSDVILPPWFYRQLLEYDKPFISGVSVDKMEQIKEPAPFGSIHLHPDFSAYLIKREAWEKVGPFDESMKFYASDNDWHVRAHRAGVQLWKANVPFYHERSSTLRLASPEERVEIEAQANADRAVFQKKYGCQPWGPGYDALFT